MNSLSPRHQSDDQSTDYKDLASTIYLLQALAFLLGGVTFIIGAIIGYLNQHHVKGTWLESHYRWQINTFWVALISVVIGTMTLPLFIGYFVLIAALIWTIHRIVYGWLALGKEKEVEPMFFKNSRI